MAKNFWVVVAVIILSVTLACADGGNIKVSVSPAPPKFFKDPTSGMEMVYVKGGCYQMGDIFDDPEGGSEEKPVHEACVDDFYMGKHEVTQGQWKQIMGSNPSIDSCGKDNCPVDNVSWSDVQDFIRRLNSRSGASKYRLPTEAEWEYAARSGGKNEKYSGGNDVDSVAWYGENAGKKNHPVGTKAPNGLGIYDMSGNVWEWTNDWYGSDYYSNSPRNNPAGPSNPAGPGVDRVIRGGCRTGEEYNLRTARRYAYWSTGNDRGGKVGFRLLRTP